ncbi:chemosensory receptor a [Plakobranchus ocellatus]|uniref:Chemosensory receptor a n=1 Tax=Plakobranchus ocellatus TaxID=259542 RepID=A0AAV4AER3_9GAST|nr:chemosensory receptor a [Plakobranchus ocellatus]
MDHEEAQYLNLSEGNGVNLALGNDAVAIDWKKWDAMLVYPIVTTLFFSVLGLGTNITNIVVFIKMGLQETTTISMLALAVSDFLCCLLSLWTYMCYLPAFRDLPSLPFEPSEISSETGVNVRAYLTRTGALITTFITLERCLCVVVPMKVKNIITVPVTRISMVAIYAVTVLPYIAHMFQIKLDWKFYPHLNRTRLGAVYLNNPVVSAVIQSQNNTTTRAASRTSQGRGLGEGFGGPPTIEVQGAKSLLEEPGYPEADELLQFDNENVTFAGTK